MLERNQQRRMELSSVDNPAGQSSVLDTIVSDHVTSAMCARVKRSRTAFNPARTIANRKPAAARIESSAVTGPWTTEYGPSIPGKKKIVSTERTANTARAHPIRPRVMRVASIIIRGRGFCLYALSSL